MPKSTRRPDETCAECGELKSCSWVEVTLPDGFLAMSLCRQCREEFSDILETGFGEFTRATLRT